MTGCFGHGFHILSLTIISDGLLCSTLFRLRGLWCGKRLGTTDPDDKLLQVCIYSITVHEPVVTFWLKVRILHVVITQSSHIIILHSIKWIRKHLPENTTNGQKYVKFGLSVATEDIPASLGNYVHIGRWSFTSSDNIQCNASDIMERYRKWRSECWWAFNMFDFHSGDRCLCLINNLPSCHLNQVFSLANVHRIYLLPAVRGDRSDYLRFWLTLERPQSTF